ncbi:MAG: glutamine synthetase [Polyangiaceae bacterium]|nr:glutamine synthetase [Polyangiaceae bacterium]
MARTSKSKATTRTTNRVEHDPRLSAEEAEALVTALKERGIQHAKIGAFDIDGILRGKYVSLQKLTGALKKGFGFCDVVFGWDATDTLYDNATVTGWHTGYPDALTLLDPTTARDIPWEPGVVAMLGDFRGADGKGHPGCGRSLLRRVIRKAESLGFEPLVGVEFEFFLFQETPQTLQEKGFRGMTPADPGMFGYSWLRTGQDPELMASVLRELGDYGLSLDGFHTETGPGVYEAALQVDSALRAADKAALFKTALKEVVRRHGLVATFMAKWNAELPGCSGHLHQSLMQNGKNVFFDPRASRGMSKLMKSYMAGQLKLMREFTALYSPTVNSYKRYVPGLWAPLVPSWGVENRTCALRIVGLGESNAQRVEYRQTAADINPYIAIAASIAAGLYGVEQGLELQAESVGDPGVDGERLPTTLREATALLGKSKLARRLLGEEFVDHYVRTRDWECRAYEQAVSDWELRRYFEII